MEAHNSHELPPGFRFHPTDEELIMYYLRNQATSRPCPISIIPEIEIYKFDPWELPDKNEFGENEWYFFSPRDRKYPNGVRPNRATVSGYWKATGTDKAIHSGSKYVGVKKALVFYKGRPPKGVKSDWIMHEYRLTDPTSRPVAKLNWSMRLDEWVLCRIYKKKQAGRALEQMEEDSDHSQMPGDDQQMLKHPGTSSFAHPLEMDKFGAISQIPSDNSDSFNSTFGYQDGIFGAGIRKFNFCEMDNRQYTDAVKFQVMNNQATSFLNQQMAMNPSYQFP